MIWRLRNGVYDFVQPDASVIGGLLAVMEVFAAARREQVDVVVHAWGGQVAIMASYHAAFAGGGRLAEYPMLAFPLGPEMLTEPLRIVDGELRRPEAPGIGTRLTPEIESRYPFDTSAVYSCKLQEYERHPEEYWRGP